MFQLLAYVVKTIHSLSYKFQGGNTALNDALLGHELAIIRKHYYTPLVSAGDLSTPLDAVRNLPGLNLDPGIHREFLASFKYESELLAIADAGEQDGKYSFTTGMFGPGDSEILYGAIRSLKPRRLVEVGAGGSTLIAQEAIKRNREENANYKCAHVCIEPYENPWLDKLDVEVVRQKVQDVPLSLFTDLSENDILFIDSSHVVRPQSDVMYEIFDIYGALQPGVYTHVHDIFTPRDYPHQWVIIERRLWHEQYLLEAYLSFNPKIEVVCALNWLWNDHPEMLKSACPVLSTRYPNSSPGSFWFKTL